MSEERYHVERYEYPDIPEGPDPYVHRRVIEPGERCPDCGGTGCPMPTPKRRDIVGLGYFETGPGGPTSP